MTKDLMLVELNREYAGKWCHHTCEHYSIEINPSCKIFGELKQPNISGVALRNRKCIEAGTWFDGPEDKEDSFTPLIEAYHPTKTKNHTTYQLALELIGNRFSKYSLVDLVNYLLCKNEELTLEGLKIADERDRAVVLEHANATDYKIGSEKRAKETASAKAHCLVAEERAAVLESVVKEVQRFMPIVNKVTALHRHGADMRKSALDDLCNCQLELEEVLRLLAPKGTK